MYEIYFPLLFNFNLILLQKDIGSVQKKTTLLKSLMCFLNPWNQEKVLLLYQSFLILLWKLHKKHWPRKKIGGKLN